MPRLPSDDAPLHRPEGDDGGGEALVVVRANAPELHDAPWIGFAELDVRSARRVDVTAWTEEPATRPAALAMLLPAPFAGDYPERVAGLFDALKRDFDVDMVHRLLVAASQTREAGAPMHVVLGTPMTSTTDARGPQQIAVWEIDATIADGLRLSAPHSSDSEALERARVSLKAAVLSWAETSPLRWCHVVEDRPEIVVRRDDRSPIADVFCTRTVAVWGCGAIGGHVAEWVARAGATKLLLADDAIVTPSVLARQPYTDADIGSPKAYALAQRLRAIAPATQLEPRVGSVLDVAPGDGEWHSDADVIIDATCSCAVRAKLEELRRRDRSSGTTLISILLGDTAQRAIAVIAPPGYSGGVADVLRQAKLRCAASAHLRGFADEFWPPQPHVESQPEAGTSTVTSRGAGAEVVALTATLLRQISSALADRRHAADASAQLVALPDVEHQGVRAASLRFSPATVLQDGVGAYELRVAPAALADVRASTARNDRALDPALQTGGVLYGSRDEASRIVWIDSVTGPPPGSRASPTEFVCGTGGVADSSHERLRRSRGELHHLGIWHTHPRMAPAASLKDLGAMLNLIAAEPIREAVLLIVGDAAARLAGYVFSADALQSDDPAPIIFTPHPSEPPQITPASQRDIGVALSGSGSRALAFHLGCLRALHDRGVLDRVRVVCGVSGGALMTVLWAYGSERFEQFDASVCDVLRRGLHAPITRGTQDLPQLATNAMSGTRTTSRARIARIARTHGLPPARGWTSGSDTFEGLLRNVLGDRRLDSQRHADGLDVVITACELQTAGALRFGSQHSASSQLGRIADNNVTLATAVAASTAHPPHLPALERRWTFEQHDGSRQSHNLVLTDGAIVDNLATACLGPDRSGTYSSNAFDVDFVIACDAGHSQRGEDMPTHGSSPLSRSFETSLTELQHAARGELQDRARHGELEGLVMPYLDQHDHTLPAILPDLVRRDQVPRYPTDFAAMSDTTLTLLTTRGEQLTRILIERYSPDL
ncbi:MAG: hypothetical protein QOJ89_101 [bacterium]